MNIIRQVDPQIEKHLLLAQQHPLGSKERKRYFNRLMRCLERYLSYNPYNLSREDFDEVKNNVREALYKGIDKLEPGYIISWIKEVMKNKSKDMIRVRVRVQSREISFDKTTDDGQTPWLELITQPEPDPVIAALKDIIDKDPDQMLQNSMRGRPDLTWQWMLQHRLQGQWKELAQISGKTISSLSSFDKREIKRLTPYLREALSS